MARIIPALVGTLVLAACAKAVTGPNSAKDLTSLAGSEWGFEGKDEPFVNFDNDGNMNGNGGCNNFGGSYELNGQRLIIGPIMSTKKACMGPKMDIESRFFSALQNAHHVKATHLRLVIFDENSEELLSLVRRDWD
ncbi:MAG: META domain-containing protein [Hellea sp.]|nr:META domain-containing protein [Hellea sp.]